MGHWLVNLSIIAAILVCPYACQGGVGCCPEPDRAVSSICCERCAEGSESDEHPAPASPTDESQSSCCLCHGAILGTVALDHLLLADATFVLPAMIVLPVVPQSDDFPLCSETATKPFGDGLRIALGSLLC